MTRDQAFGDAILVVTAVIWGTTFIAQKIAMAGIGPMTYSGLRFLLGALFLVPFLWKHRSNLTLNRSHALMTVALGVVLFLASNFQQVALVWTLPSKTAFLTSFYIILVPILMVLLGYKNSRSIWVSCLIALVATYFIVIPENLALDKLNYGDILAFICALFFAIHILLIGKVANKLNIMLIAIGQYLVCGVLSISIGAVYEFSTWPNIGLYVPEIIYGGIMSITIAYTLQIYGQTKSPAPHAAILLSLEAVFASISEMFFFNYDLPLRVYFGYTLMFAAVLCIYLPQIVRLKTHLITH